MLNEVVLQPRSGKVARAVIILHGLGDSASGIIGLGEVFAQGMPDTLFVAPDAPFPCEYSPFGYQWFPANDWSSPLVLQGVKKAAAILNDYIDHVTTTLELKAEQVGLVGFSQGSMMSLYVGPRRTEQLACIVGYSGALIGGELLPFERKSNPPTLLIHGEEDPVVPFSFMDHAREGLQNANMNVSTFICPGVGHSIDDRGFAEGLRFMRRAFVI